MACLFDRFNSLAVDTTAAKTTTVPSTAGGRLPASTPAVAQFSLRGSACALPPPASVPRTPLGPARRVAVPPGARAASAAAMARGSGRVRVSFGTPVVHRYDSAPRAERAEGNNAVDESPQPSTAGHTPFGRNAGRGSGRGRGADSSLLGPRIVARSSGGPSGVSPLGAPDFEGACIEEGDEVVSDEDGGTAGNASASVGDLDFSFKRPSPDVGRTPSLPERQPREEEPTPTLLGSRVFNGASPAGIGVKSVSALPFLSGA